MAFIGRFDCTTLPSTSELELIIIQEPVDFWVLEVGFEFWILLIPYVSSAPQLGYIEKRGQDLRGNDALSPVSTTHTDLEHRWRGTIMVVKWKQLSVHTHPYQHL